MPWNISDEFYNVGQMILIPGVVLPRVRLEEIVSCCHLKGHACCGPDVGGWAISCTQEDFQASVLAGLDIFREVVVLKNCGKIVLFYILFSKDKK